MPARIPTMITPAEQQYLHWLGRDFWSGCDDAVEVGPWLGGSTYCLASGMAANPRRTATSRLHVVDNFRWQDFMGARAPLGLAAGDSFRAPFESNLADHADLIEIHEVRLPDEPIAEIQGVAPLGDFDRDLPLFAGSDLGNRVEIAFIDGAKSWRALAHLLSELGPLCIPGRTLLVFQDYKISGGYWIQMGTSWLIEAAPTALELLHALPFNSVAFRLTDSFDPQLFERLPDTIDAISTTDGTALLDRGRSFLEAAGDERAARFLDLSAPVFLGSKGAWTEARARFRAAEARWPAREKPDELDRVRRWLEQSSGRRLRRSLRSRAGDVYRHTREKAGGLKRRVASESSAGPGGTATRD